MNEEFDLDDFEKLLQNQTEKHRIYPSDAVWRNINNSLHGERRWPALTFSAVLISAILTAGFIFLHPNKNLFDHPDFIIENNNVGKSKLIAANKQNKINNKLIGVRSFKPTDEKLAIYSINRLAAAPTVDLETINETETAFDMPSSNNALVSLNEPINEPLSIPVQTKVLLETAPKTASYQKLDNRITKNIASKGIIILQSALAQQSVVTNKQSEENSTEKENIEQKIENQEVPENAIDKASLPASPKPTKVTKEKIENPWEISFYVTPSVSYRNLSLDQSFDYHYPFNPALGGNPQNDVNKYVDQRPALGIGAGATVSYAISNRFRITGGLQFNYRQYNFKAYITATQQAPLLLNRGNYADSLVTFSNVRTAGINAVSIGNYYFQLSAPIGFQYTAIQGKKVDILFGANLQPTYQFNKDMYMLTSDFKAYTIEPSLARRWNINTGIEIMARFKAAGVQWEVGPQLRYQITPTQISSYIIHENLIDYGLKIGIVKQFK